MRGEGEEEEKKCTVQFIGSAPLPELIHFYDLFPKNFSLFIFIVSDIVTLSVKLKPVKLQTEIFRMS